MLPLAFAQTNPPATPQQLPTVHERVEVTATRLPESPDRVPAAIEVFTGDELRARGVWDLRSALALAIGVEIAPGGDNGPASAVPAFWGQQLGPARDHHYRESTPRGGGRPRDGRRSGHLSIRCQSGRQK